jgi:hypothetical protein
MSKLVSALRRTLIGGQNEPAVHFHQAQNDAFPEVCHNGACERPRLAIRSALV